MPASPGGVDQGVSHGIRVGVRPPAGVVVQVVEFADRGDAGQRHLGVHRAGQLAVAVRGQPVGGGVHQRRATSRTSRGRVGCGSAARGETRASGRWPGRESPARATWCPVRGLSGSTAVMTPSATVTGTRVGHGCPHPARRVRTTSRDCRHADTQSAMTSASASAPSRQSAISAYSSGECETPVGLRTNSIAVGTFADRIAGVVSGLRSAAPGRHRSRRPAPAGSAPAARRGKARRERSDSASTVDRVPIGAGVAGGVGGDLRRPARVSVASSGARASSQAWTCDGMALAPLGVTPYLAERRDRVVRGRARAGVVHRGGEGQHRVAPVDQPGGAGVVGLAAER